MANRPQTAIAPADATDVAEGVLRLPSLALHHGGVLRDVQLAWRMTGPADAPCVVVMGGISGHRRVFGPPGEERGWWQEVAGEGGSFPSDRVRMLAFDYLGGSGATTGPRPDHVPGAFPTVSSHDQAALLALLLDHLGIDAVDAIVGASYGGMVALAFAQRNAARVRRLLVVSAADRTDPMSTAWRSMQREVLRFAISCGRGADGLRLARAMAMSTYRSRSEFAQRFDGEARRASPDARLTFPVEEYLLARGDDYARRFPRPVRVHRPAPRRCREHRRAGGRGRGGGGPACTGRRCACDGRASAARPAACDVLALRPRHLPQGERQAAAVLRRTTPRVVDPGRLSDAPYPPLPTRHAEHEIPT
jgi:homoserine acetyltransferase